MSTSTASRPVPLRRLLGLARPQAGILGLATVALLIGSGVSLAYPQAVGWLVDGVVGGAEADLNQLGLLLAALFVVQAVFAMVRSWLFTLAGERIVTQLRHELFRAILGQDTAFFDASRTGELTNRLASDTTVLQNTVSVNISMALRFSFGAIGGAILMAWKSWELTLVAAAVVPLVAVGGAVYGRLVRRLSKEVQDALAEATAVAEEALQGVRTVRSFVREPEEIGRYGGAVDHSYALAAKRALAMGVFQGGMTLAGYVSIGLVVWWGGSLVVEGAMTVGDLTGFVLYTLTVAVALSMLSNLYSDFMRASGASQRVFELIDQKPEIEGTGGEKLPAVVGEVRFADVDFAYPTRPEAQVLRGLNLHVAPGEVVALVGPSGAGKSTIAGLLARFYDPQGGRVEVDGHDLRGLDPAGLREHIAMVAQEPVLFAGSIAENLRYGRPDATEDQLREAASAANALNFIEAFPDGFATLVGERGVRLSGGQKQRIAIARALLKDPAILILDEATSALDAESEHLVQEALDRLVKGRTTLVIAHRLSTVRDAHRVAVIDGGVVAEQGTHDELLAKNGVYRQLVERQLAA